MERYSICIKSARDENKMIFLEVIDFKKQHYCPLGFASLRKNCFVQLPPEGELFPLHVLITFYTAFVLL